MLAVIVPLQPFLLSLPRVIPGVDHCRCDDGSLLLALYKLNRDAALLYHYVASSQLFHCSPSICVVLMVRRLYLGFLFSHPFIQEMEKKRERKNEIEKLKISLVAADIFYVNKCRMS